MTTTLGLMGLSFLLWVISISLNVPELSWGSVGFLGVLGVALLVDFIRLKECIEQRFFLKNLRNKSEFITSAGAHIAQLLEALHHRVSVLERQVDSEQERLSPVVPEKAAPFLQNTKEQAGDDRNKLLREVLSHHRDRFLTTLMVFQYNDEQGYAHQISLSLLARVLEERITKLCQEGPYGRFAWVEEEVKGLDVLPGYGVDGFVLYPLRWRSAGVDCSGVLFLGYSLDQPPTESELVLGKKLASLLQEQCHTYSHVRLLREQVREAEARERGKSEYLTQVSHDIRSPLNNIRTILHLIENEHEDLQELTTVALSNCERVTELVQDIVDYARYHAGALVSRPQQLLVSQVIDGVVESYRVAAKMKGLVLEWSGSSTGLEVLFDQVHLTRILSNLVGNAIKYTIQGFVRVSVVRRENSDEIEIQVQDSGPGLSSEQVQRLFEPFTRFHGGDGIGLGLSLSKILAEQNSAFLSASSEEGHGSTFTLRLRSVVGVQPAASGEFLTVVPPPSVKSSLVSQHTLRERSILLVDDDKDSLDIFERVLSKEGFLVLKASSCAEALGVLNFGDPDFVISDFHLEDGTALQIIEKSKTSGKKLTFVILTGSDEQEMPEMPTVAQVFRKPTDYHKITEWLLQHQDNEEQFSYAAHS